MKKYVVSLLAFLFFFLALQASHAAARHSVRVGTSSAVAGRSVIVGNPSRGFAARVGQRHFVSPAVIIINRGPSRFVRVSPFARDVVILHRRHLVPHTVILGAPFSCFRHGIGFIDEASFFDHLHTFHGLAFEDIQSVVDRSGPEVFLGD